MDSEHNTPVRIVVKKRGGHGGHHGGAWKVAYADFVTAMMALFIVLWIVGQSNAIKEAIAAYFKDPGVFKEMTKNGGILPGALQPLPKKDPSPPDLIQKEMEKLQAESKKLEEMIASVPNFQKFKDKIQISVTKDGMRIELIENSEGLFFDVGSAKVKDETIRLLKLLAKEIGTLQNPVIIEGHTDSRPYVTKGYSNWELSADRANTARKILEENGMRKDQVTEVRGYADRLLKSPDRPLDFSNRRVNIIVMIPQSSVSSGPQEPSKPADAKAADVKPTGPKPAEVNAK